jgi:two-component system chemotaxis sensor kinase CheA
VSTQSGTGFIGDSLKQMARRLAGRYGKQVELTALGLEDHDLKPEARKAIKDILIQLVRNSIYHGIEEPERRKTAGKAEHGTIDIRADGEGSNLRIVYRDDGAGMDAEKIKLKAVKKGIISRERADAMNEREQVMLIFHPGFSTAENPDRTAGKGVGLSLVKTRVRELNGKLFLKSRRGSHSEFTLVFPFSALTGGLAETPKTNAG